MGTELKFTPASPLTLIRPRLVPSGWCCLYPDTKFFHIDGYKFQCGLVQNRGSYKTLVYMELRCPWLFAAPAFEQCVCLDGAVSSRRREGANGELILIHTPSVPVDMLEALTLVDG